MTVQLSVLAGFEVAVSYRATDVDLRVRGDLDSTTAPDLDAILTAVVDAGHIRIVLDFADLTFIDAAGLNVVVRCAQNLGSSRTLAIRSETPFVRRLLEVTGLGFVVEFDATEPRVAIRDPYQMGGDPSLSLAETQRNVDHVAAFPANDDVIDAALRLIVALASRVVTGANGVSVTLKRHGQFTTVAASNATIAQMDRDQYATGEGPCISAATEGQRFHAESLTDETRWPRFVPRAIDDGIRSILSTPLTTPTRSVGALNIYSEQPRVFGPVEQELAALLAKHTSGILTDTEKSATEFTQRIQDALTARTIIAQAQGTIMESDGVTEQEADVFLRVSSRQSGVPVRELAAQIVASAGANRCHIPRP